MKVAYLLPLILVCCGPDKPIGEPAGSNNFDDPDDPGQSGQNSGGPDASGDASGRFCTAARDCPSAYVCAYPIADACGAAGRCLAFDTQTCTAGNGCGCDGNPVQLCAPSGYAPKPVASASPCAQDAAADVAADVVDDVAPE